MDLSRFDQLSDDQKQYLRLLFANLSIKEIGIETDISPNTVKGRLKLARRILGVDRSMKAAILFVRHERDTLGIDPPRSLGIERDLIEAIGTAAPVQTDAPARIRNQFGFLSRIGLIVAIAAGVVLFAGGLFVGIEAISQIFRAEQIDISDYPYRH
jgi:DNA-binding CsgD family transcriptional regulator